MEEEKIPSKKPSLKSLAGKQIDKLEDYALKSNLLRKLGTTIYNSTLYTHFSKRIDKFRDYKLIEQVKQNQAPEHVAIIMDGNRRFATELGLPPNTGHLFGKDKLEEVLEWCFELDIKPSANNLFTYFECTFFV